MSLSQWILVVCGFVPGLALGVSIGVLVLSGLLADDEKTAKKGQK